MDLELLRALSGNTAIRICFILLVACIAHLSLRATISLVIHRLLDKVRFHSQEERKKRENTLISTFQTLGAVIIWIAAVLFVLVELNVNLTALLTGAGVFGVVVGFGAQNSIKDFLAGVFIIGENQFRVGDIVSIKAAGSDISGIVEEITIRITKLRNLDGQLHIIPNGSIEIVTNLTFEFANVNIDVGVSYDSDIDKVEEVMNQVGKEMAEDNGWKNMINEPIQFLRVDRFGDSQIIIKALGRVEPASQWEVAGEFRRRLKKAFEKNNISIPFPQVVVHKDK